MAVGESTDPSKHNQLSIGNPKQPLQHQKFEAFEFFVGSELHSSQSPKIVSRRRLHFPSDFSLTSHEDSCHRQATSLMQTSHNWQLTSSARHEQKLHQANKNTNFRVRTQHEHLIYWDSALRFVFLPKGNIGPGTMGNWQEKAKQWFGVGEDRKGRKLQQAKSDKIINDDETSSY